MKQLTTTQLRAIQTLANNPLIASTSIEFFKNEISRITINSIVGAYFNEVNAILNSTLDEEFPNLEYRGLPTKEYFPIDEKDHEYYFLDFEGETLITLVMRIEPVKEVWSAEDILRQEG